MIRLAKQEELGRMLEIYDGAKAYMIKTGNPTQWNGAYPDEETLMKDIQKEQLFVMEDSETIYGCFALIGGEDPTYAVVEGGNWKSDSPYGTIHRIASDGSKRAVFKECIEYARETYNHLRVDTHEDNGPMQKVILENGFTYQGIIYIEDGTPRLAYEWIEEAI